VFDGVMVRDDLRVKVDLIISLATLVGPAEYQLCLSRNWKSRWIIFPCRISCNRHKKGFEE